MKALAAHINQDLDSAHTTHARGYQPRQLVLLGGGMANLHMLSALAARPLPEMRIILLAPYPRTLYPGMLPGLVAGRYSMDECAIPLEPLVRRAGIRWLQRNVQALDAGSQTLQLDDGSSQHYDWLSINTGRTQNREQIERDMPGAAEFGLFVHPLETFAQLWPRVCDLASSKALRVAVVGDHTAALELALAVRQRLPASAVTLVVKPGEGGVPLDSPVHARLVTAMKAQRITVLQDVALALTAEAVHLGCGARLACDVPLIALESQSPAWLGGSGLALDGQGQLALDAYQRSSSHPQVFSATDDNEALVQNLPAAATGASLQAVRDTSGALQLLFGGSQQAVAAWGPYSATGRSLRWLKEWSDRRHVARFLQAGL
nr:FAD-dependent oxidoreductase [uncultured Rhodoferax sp.]